MPVFSFSYRPFEGKYIRRFRWWVVFLEEVRLWNRSRIFIVLFILGMLQPIARFIQIILYNAAIQDPNHPLAPLIRSVTWIKVDNELYFHFIRLQAPLVLLILLYVGAGAICADRKNRLWDIYFSKPIHWYDYLLGKLLSVVFCGFSLTFFPALILMLTDYTTKKSSTWLGLISYFPIVSDSLFFSLILVLPIALGIIAASSIFSTENITVISIVTLIIANTSLAGLLSNFMRDGNYMQVSLPVAIYFMGQRVFNIDRNIFFRTMDDINVTGMFLYIVSCCVLFLLISIIQVRKAEKG
ncbi:MAG TPA: hypothetical protein PLX23_08900 [Candidatus Hydrogenedens sp.]|nr:hypothetical protein [Candidatus Hydrogenedens sp.]